MAQWTTAAAQQHSLSSLNISLNMFNVSLESLDSERPIRRSHRSWSIICSSAIEKQTFEAKIWVIILHQQKPFSSTKCEIALTNTRYYSVHIIANIASYYYSDHYFYEYRCVHLYFAENYQPRLKSLSSFENSFCPSGENNQIGLQQQTGDIAATLHTCVF
jgi:hypothetical protein